jgi:hypothetical protein
MSRHEATESPFSKAEKSLCKRIENSLFKAEFKSHAMSERFFPARPQRDCGRDSWLGDLN